VSLVILFVNESNFGGAVMVMRKIYTDTQTIRIPVMLDIFLRRISSHAKQGSLGQKGARNQLRGQISSYKTKNKPLLPLVNGLKRYMKSGSNITISQSVLSNCNDQALMNIVKNMK
jgi:hypothetical protein